MISAAIVGTGNISTQHINGVRAFPARCRITRLNVLDALENGSSALVGGGDGRRATAKGIMER